MYSFICISGFQRHALHILSGWSFSLLFLRVEARFVCTFSLSQVPFVVALMFLLFLVTCVMVDGEAITLD